MAATVYQTDKRSGITYAYQSFSFWDKEKQQSRSKRSLIGRVDKETSEIVPTDGRGRKNKQEAISARRGPVPANETARSFYGATYPKFPEECIYEGEITAKASSISL